MDKEKILQVIRNLEELRDLSAKRDVKGNGDFSVGYCCGYYEGRICAYGDAINALKRAMGEEEKDE